MKKILALLVIFVLLFSACSSSTTEDEKINLTWYTIGAPPTDGEIVNQEINKYLDELDMNFNVEIIYFDYSEYDDKLSVKLNSGENFDIMFSASWAANYSKNAQEGYYYDLSEFEDNELKETFDTISPVLVEGATVNGGIYGVPTNKEVGWDQQWIWDTELVEKYDVPINEIDTFREAMPYIEMVVDDNPDIDGYPIDVYQTMPQLVFQSLDCVLTTQICLDLDNPELGYTNSLENEETVDLLKARHELQEGGYAGEGLETTNYDETSDNAFLQTGSGYPTIENVWEVSKGKDLTVLPVMETAYATTSSTTGSLNVINANSSYPSESAELLNLVNTDSKMRNMLAYGVEDIHYTLNDSNEVVRTDEGINNYEVPQFAQGNFFIMYLQEGDDEEKWNLMSERNNTTRMSPALGFSPDLSEFSTELAAIATVDEQYAVSVVMGEADNMDEAIEEYIDALNNAGYDVLIQEINRQYNDWLDIK